MSLTLTLTGTISILTASYFPALDLSNGEYELGLTNFETYNTIPNVISTNNKFYFDTDDKIITILEGSYELSPFVVIDCSRQNESIKSATVDIRIEFECKENIPLNTTAYCLIIHDKMIEYNPLINVIRKIV
ncbi:hypothetical protein ALC56_10595 [Trachymyrmex septentrionalis]|uniref:Double jelly roll-like domain-containing protein n=1 Tax=Trachymyrmex septentrionalis TaxID=34720 RepID=A0A151JTR2_9HYME|nr:hypothetical protein ALC56_10595 [Trachymyrmex septentrionalis]